jgi:hypothetical protein
MEINYGDQHFRRTDNGNAMYNPLVGNTIMDAFTTEIGAELYFTQGPFMLMGGVTGGEIKGDIGNVGKRGATILGKVAFDKKFNDDFRFRLSASIYTTPKSASNTLFGGDRAGSRYYLVMENTLASTTSNAFSGRLNPGFRDKVTSFVINPFIKWKGLELFGLYEMAKGRASNETADRSWNQFAVDLLYRFFKNENLYLAGRYNQAKGTLAGMTTDVTISRIQAGLGWYLNNHILMKAEYVQQKYMDYPSTSIFNGGQFSGGMIEAVVGF